MTVEFSSLILDNLVTAVVLLDEQLTIHYVNPAAEQLLACSKRRMDNTRLPDLLQHTSLDLACYRRSCKAAKAWPTAMSLS